MMRRKSPTASAATTTNPYTGYSGGASTMSIPSGGGEYGNSYSYGTSPSYAASNLYTQKQPQGYSSDDTFKDKPVSRRSRGSIFSYATQPLAWAAFVSLVFFSSTIHFRGERNWILQMFQVPSTRELYNAFHDEQGRLTRCKDEGMGGSSSSSSPTPLEEELQNDISLLERQIKALESERDIYKKRSNKLIDDQTAQHIDSLNARDYAWKEQVGLLQNATQRESKRSATELFGPGPHHVKFTVVLPTDEKATEHHFTIEMAPLEIMPHSVHFFLQQVVHGLWNNAWFYLNGPHVMQAGPQATEDEEELWHLSHEDDDERAVALRDFRRANLETLAFPEYSPKFPHQKWTLGFTGRPGGPDFYLNKLDNRKSHGPGGQYQHELTEYGDPCFAKVVDGFDTLELMFKEPTFPHEHEWGWFYEDPVHIVRAKIMEDAPLKIEVAKENNDHSQKPDKPLKKPKLETQVTP